MAIYECPAKMFFLNMSGKERNIWPIKRGNLTIRLANKIIVEHPAL